MTGAKHSLADQTIDWRERAEQLERRERALQEQLQQLKESLLQAEKLASLGARVASVAHEINTPVGNSLTVAGALLEKTREIERQLAEGQLRQSMLTVYLGEVAEAADLLNRNLQIAGELIGSFKRVAVDQASEQRRRFDLGQVVAEVIGTLRPLIKRSHFRIRLEVPDDIRMNSYPGPLAQVITNCFNNAVTHGLADREEGEFCVRAERRGSDQVEIILSDDGRGMNEEQCSRAFRRFYTTRGGQGGTGLGLSIVHSIVTELLMGEVWIESVWNRGTAVHIRIPCNPPGPNGANEESDGNAES